MKCFFKGRVTSGLELVLFALLSFSSLASAQFSGVDDYELDCDKRSASDRALCDIEVTSGHEGPFNTMSRIPESFGDKAKKEGAGSSIFDGEYEDYESDMPSLLDTTERAFSAREAKAPPLSGEKIIVGSNGGVVSAGAGITDVNSLAEAAISAQGGATGSVVATGAAVKNMLGKPIADAEWTTNLSRAAYATMMLTQINGARDYARSMGQINQVSACIKNRCGSDTADCQLKCFAARPVAGGPLGNIIQRIIGTALSVDDMLKKVDAFKDLFSMGGPDLSGGLGGLGGLFGSKKSSAVGRQKVVARLGTDSYARILVEEPTPGSKFKDTLSGITLGAAVFQSGYKIFTGAAGRRDYPYGVADIVKGTARGLPGFLDQVKTGTDALGSLGGKDKGKGKKSFARAGGDPDGEGPPDDGPPADDSGSDLPPEPKPTVSGGDDKSVIDDSSPVGSDAKVVSTEMNTLAEVIFDGFIKDRRVPKETQAQYQQFKDDFRTYGDAAVIDETLDPNGRRVTIIPHYQMNSRDERREKIRRATVRSLAELVTLRCRYFKAVGDEDPDKQVTFDEPSPGFYQLINMGGKEYLKNGSSATLFNGYAEIDYVKAFKLWTSVRPGMGAEMPLDALEWMWKSAEIYLIAEAKLTAAAPKDSVQSKIDCALIDKVADKVVKNPDAVALGSAKLDRTAPPNLESFFHYMGNARSFIRVYHDIPAVLEENIEAILAASLPEYQAQLMVIVRKILGRSNQLYAAQLEMSVQDFKQAMARAKKWYEDSFGKITLRVNEGRTY